MVAENHNRYNFVYDEENDRIIVNDGLAELSEGNDLYMIIDDDYQVWFSNDPDNYRGLEPVPKQEFFGGCDIAKSIWKEKYTDKGERNPGNTFNRLIKAVFEAESKYPNPMSEQEIRDLLWDFKKVAPGGSIIRGAGSKTAISLANCFAIDGAEDSYGGILYTDQEQIQLMNRRGGVGHDLSKLRPLGTPVKNAAKTSTGLVSFARRFSDSTLEVAQGGRRGALMLTLDAEHPESMLFINSKLNENAINGANISLKLRDGFLEKAFSHLNKRKGSPNGEDHPGVRNFRGDLEEEMLGKQSQFKPHEILSAIADAQWKSAEPGILFWDRIINESPADCYASDGFKTVTTNPCGEIPLAPYDSCRLLHMVLFNFVDKPFTPEAEFLFEEYSESVRKAQRILDDIIDLELEKVNQILAKIDSDPEPWHIKTVERDLWTKIKEKLINGRRTGLGYTGLGDTMAALGMKYDSPEAISFAEQLSKETAIASYKESIVMAKERGSFPIFSHNKEHNHIFIERILALLDDEPEYVEMYAKYGRRNISNLTIAPTGTVSILVGTSSGMEPVFDIVYDRKIKQQTPEGDVFKTVRIIHRPFKLWYDINKKALTGINIEDMSVEQIRSLIPDSPYAGSLAGEIEYSEKIKLQGKLNKYIDHSISVTHNIPAKTSRNHILAMIQDAWEYGCKGFTIYREGSRAGILSSVRDGEDINNKISYHDAIKRPKEIQATATIYSIKGVKYCVLIGELNGLPYEVFAFEIAEEKVSSIVSAKDIKIVKLDAKKYALSIDGNRLFVGFNKSMNADAELICRLVSISLRHGVDINFIYEQIHKPNIDMNNFAKVISRSFKKYLKDSVMNRKGSVDACPACGSNLLMQEGCVICSECTFSRC